MLGSAIDVFHRVMGVLTAGAGLGCVWLGGRAVLRPCRPPEPIHGPVWVVRTWGVGFVLLGTCLVVETLLLMTGGERGWPADVIRWAAGPLVVGSIVASVAARRWERHRARPARGRRRP